MGNRSKRKQVKVFLVDENGCITGMENRIAGAGAVENRHSRGCGTGMTVDKEKQLEIRRARYRNKKSSA